MAIAQSNLTAVLTAAQGSMVAASGTITISATDVSNDDTITVNGVTYTFKTTATASTHVGIGVDNDATAAALQAKLAGVTTAAVAKAVYTVTDNVVTATYKVPGTIGNAFTLAKSAAEITLSGATLASGADTGATDYASDDTAEGETAPLRQDSDFEKNVLALIATAEAIVTLGANPSTSADTALQARRQRRTLKHVLQVLASVVPSVSDATADDRAGIASRIRLEALRRYNNVNQPTGL